jgi:hypothetical protein
MLLLPLGGLLLLVAIAVLRVDGQGDPEPTFEVWGGITHFVDDAALIHAVVGSNVKPTVNAKLWVNGVPTDPKWVLQMETLVSQESPTYPGLLDDLLVKATIDMTKLMVSQGDIVTVEFEGYSESGEPQTATIITTVFIALAPDDCIEDCLCQFLDAIDAGKDPQTGAVTIGADACQVAAAAQALKDCLIDVCGLVNEKGKTFIPKDLDGNGQIDAGEGFSMAYDINGDQGTSGLDSSVQTNNLDIALAVGGTACHTCTANGGNAIAINGKPGGASSAVGGNGGDHSASQNGNPGNGGSGRACSAGSGGQGGISIGAGGNGGNNNGAGQSTRGNGGRGEGKSSNQSGRAEGKGGDGGKPPNGTSAGGDGGDSNADTGGLDVEGAGGKSCGAGKYGTGAYTTRIGGQAGGGDGTCEDLP